MAPKICLQPATRRQESVDHVKWPRRLVVGKDVSTSTDDDLHEKKGIKNYKTVTHLRMLYLISAHLVKLFDLSDVTGHLRVTGLNPPVKTRRRFVVSRSGPVDSKQEPLCQWRCHDNIQLPTVHQHLDTWKNSAI